jgi:hypothetical protein
LCNQIKEGSDFWLRVFEDPLLFFHAEMGGYVLIYGKGFKPAVFDFPAGCVLGSQPTVEERHAVAEHSAVIFFIIVSVHGVSLWVDIVDHVAFVDRMDKKFPAPQMVSRPPRPLSTLSTPSTWSTFHLFYFKKITIYRFSSQKL